jgi:hypothetical protein
MPNARIERRLFLVLCLPAWAPGAGAQAVHRAPAVDTSYHRSPSASTGDYACSEDMAAVGHAHTAGASADRSAQCRMGTDLC